MQKEVSKAMSSEESSSTTVVPGGIERDLENARVLLEDPPWCDSPQKYRKSAEAIVLRILKFDPKNPLANRLLQKARVPVPESASPASPSSSPVLKQAPVREELEFVAQAPLQRSQKQERTGAAIGVAGIAAVVAIAGLAVFLLIATRSKPPNAARTVAAASPVTKPPVNVTEPQPKPQSAPAVQQPTAVPASLPAVVEEKPEPVVVKPAPPAAAPVQTGSLAVVSPTSVDIYMDNRLVGSAPTTLELPAGTQKVEYRHERLRKVLTHEIKPHEITSAVVSFEIPVQINARPWAQVSIEGSARRSIGQTPLSKVRVPVGSMLLFENPNYASKTYRVTGRETEIRVSFP